MLRLNIILIVLLSTIMISCSKKVDFSLDYFDSSRIEGEYTIWVVGMPDSPNVSGVKGVIEKTGENTFVLSLNMPEKDSIPDFKFELVSREVTGYRFGTPTAYIRVLYNEAYVQRGKLTTDVINYYEKIDKKCTDFSLSLASKTERSRYPHMGLEAEMCN